MRGPTTRTGGAEIRQRETWSAVGPAWVRAIEVGPVTAPCATVVILPGLGLPRYTRPTAEVLARRGVRCVVLDLLAWRRPRSRRVPPRVGSMGEATARWITEADVPGPLVVAGHSTGAQVALGAALRLQQDRPSHSLVLAGLTFRPEHRTWPGLLRGAATAYRRDTPAELVVARNIVTVRTDLVRLVESARRDRPEERVRALEVPLVLTAGEADSFAPQAWMEEVAASAASPGTRVKVLAGSHNNLFTHPDQVADLLAEAAFRSGRPPT